MLRAWLLPSFDIGLGAQLGKQSNQMGRFPFQDLFGFLQYSLSHEQSNCPTLSKMEQ